MSGYTCERCQAKRGQHVAADEAPTLVGESGPEDWTEPGTTVIPNRDIQKALEVDGAAVTDAVVNADD